MSIPVAVDDLAAAAADYGFAYVVTVGEDRRPHVVAATPNWRADGASIAVGRSTLRNVAAGSVVTLCFPPPDPGGYSLIADGTAEAATGDESAISFVPTNAVLHRPVTPPAGR